jgi:hypothetical protein
MCATSNGFSRRWRSAGTITSTVTAAPGARRPCGGAHSGQADDDRGRHGEGQGHFVHRGQDNWHGKAFKKGEELDKVLAELNAQFVLSRMASISRRSS